MLPARGVVLVARDPGASNIAIGEGGAIYYIEAQNQQFDTNYIKVESRGGFIKYLPFSDKETNSQDTDRLWYRWLWLQKCLAYTEQIWHIQSSNYGNTPCKCT